MILISNTKILIVPDFGETADNENMTTLKETIEATGDYSVNVLDLQAIVRSEHLNEELTEALIIELSARKLELLCSSDELLWNEHKDFYTGKRHDHPDTVVVFGKSAMLAGDIQQCNVLFINPDYNSEWPWKKQYHADRRLADLYLQNMHEYESNLMTTVTWAGTERTWRNGFPQRYALCNHDSSLHAFWENYPRMAEMSEGIYDSTKALSDFICQFASGEITNPLAEVYKALTRFPRRREANFDWICRFSKPLEIAGLTVLGIQIGVPMANGQSGFKLKVKERDYHLPLEMLNTRRELNALCDAILYTRKELKEYEKTQKRILIVPDYFTPYDTPFIRELYCQLTDMDYQVAVFMANSTLEKSRQALERRCKSKPFDIIVALETGCLLAARVAKCKRIFVNPDWAAWEWMSLRLGNNKQIHEKRGADKSGPVYTYILNADEINMAREMAERSNIRRGSVPSAGWFTEDAVESNLPVEHLKRFNTSTLIPSLRLDTDEGITILANQIHNTLSIDDE